MGTHRRVQENCTGDTEQIVCGSMVQIFCVGRLVRRDSSGKEEEGRDSFPIPFHTLLTPNWPLQAVLVATWTDVIPSHRKPKSHPS